MSVWAYDDQPGRKGRTGGAGLGGERVWSSSTGGGQQEGGCAGSLHQLPPSPLPKQTEQQPEELKVLAARIGSVEDMLKQLLA